MSVAVDAFLIIVFANILHAWVCLLWISGLSRFAGPLSASLHLYLLRLALFLPTLAMLARIAGWPFFGESWPDRWLLIRVEGWLVLLRSSRPFVVFMLGALLFGTFLIFIVQEVVPVVRSRFATRREQFGVWSGDSRLERVLREVNQKYLRAGLPMRRGRPVRIFSLDSSDDIAVLHGIMEPAILISRGLADKLDENELEAVVAHELGHWYYGGNIGMVTSWIIRAFQALNPVALVSFRTLTQVYEEACDSWAGYVTGKPAALASALLKAYRGADDLPAGQGRFSKARNANEEIEYRAELQSTRARVRALLDHPPFALASRWLPMMIGIAMGGVLWAIR